MEIPPPFSASARTDSNGVATASLVCGICGFILGPLTGIPAIITGHMALSRIKKSDGTLSGNGQALAGVILGYVTSLLIPVLAAAGFAASNAAITMARKVTAMAAATALETAIDNFQIEYGTLPDPGGSEVNTTTPGGVVLLEILLGTEKPEALPQNPRALRFLSLNEGKNRKNGLIHEPGGAIESLRDPWGGGYTVVFNKENDETLEFTIGGKPVSLEARHCAVYSNGPDHIAGTDDDVTTW